MMKTKQEIREHEIRGSNIRPMIETFVIKGDLATAKDMCYAPYFDLDQYVSRVKGIIPDLTWRLRSRSNQGQIMTLILSQHN